MLRKNLHDEVATPRPPACRRSQSSSSSCWHVFGELRNVGWGSVLRLYRTVTRVRSGASQANSTVVSIVCGQPEKKRRPDHLFLLIAELLRVDDAVRFLSTAALCNLTPRRGYDPTAN